MSYPFVGRPLGKRAAKHDPRTYKLGPALAKALPDIPAACDWSKDVPYEMWGNDKYGCCAFAAQAALIATWTKHAQSLVLLDTSQVLENYSALTGFNPLTGYDPGTILLDQLNVWRKTGFSRPGQTLDYLTGFGSIGLHDVAGIKRAITYLGGVLAGVQVPRGFLSQALGDTWDLSKLSEADRAFEGGHAIALTGYTTDGVFFNTWGTRTFMPWETLLAIGDELYGLVSRENWIGIHGVSPKTEDAAALMDEMRAV